MSKRRSGKKQFVSVLVCATAAACLLSACGKDKPTSSQSVKSTTKTVKQEQQTLSNIRVKIKDITAYAGEEIDYMAAIESAENMELNRSMVYIDSSMVDNHTPGVYKAEYTFDYLGSTVTNSVKVTILENKNPVTETAAEQSTQETTTAAETTTESTEAESTAAEAVTETASGTEAPAETTAVQEATTAAASSTPVSTEPITAVVEQALPDAVITLSTGKTVTIKMTSARYITETFTEDTYYEDGGFTFLTSELKVLFNTGEIQVVETVVTRVQPLETTAAETTAATAE